MEEELVQHIIWQCKFNNNLWKWFADLFRQRHKFYSYKQAIDRGKGRSQYIGKLWIAEVSCTMDTIWHHRNAICFEDSEPSMNSCKILIRRSMAWFVLLWEGKAECKAYDTPILERLGLSVLHIKGSRSQQVSWILPTGSQVKANTDGASRGNSGPAGFGIVFRNSIGDFLHVIAVGLGEEEIYWAECSTLVSVAKIVVRKGRLNLWLESDSQSAEIACNNNKIPWKLKSRRLEFKAKLATLKDSHIFREANIAADQAAGLSFFLQNQ